jgi:hypothetical protein
MITEQPMIAKWRYELLEKRVEVLEASLREIIEECAVDISWMGPIARLARAALDEGKHE